MADLFKGMSQSKFLDTLVEKTGLNGHELFDFINEKIDPKQNSINKMVEVLNNSSATEAKEKLDAITKKAPNTYKGTKQGLIDWASFYLPQSKIDILNKWKSSMTNGYLATRVAEYLGLPNFVWIHTAQAIKPGGEKIDIEVEYEAVLDKDRGVYTWVETSPFPVRPI